MAHCELANEIIKIGLKENLSTLEIKKVLKLGHLLMQTEIEWANNTGYHSFHFGFSANEFEQDQVGDLIVWLFEEPQFPDKFPKILNGRLLEIDHFSDLSSAIPNLVKSAEQFLTEHCGAAS